MNNQQLTITCAGERRRRRQVAVPDLAVGGEAQEQRVQGQGRGAQEVRKNDLFCYLVRQDKRERIKTGAEPEIFFFFKTRKLEFPVCLSLPLI